MRWKRALPAVTAVVVLAVALGRVWQGMPAQAQAQRASARPLSINAAFTQAARESGVPEPLLKAICYMEGRLGSHGGSPSIDGGYGCMHLVSNSRSNTLGQAARDLRVSAAVLHTDTATNIRGGAAALRDAALRLSGGHRLPATLAGWYGAVAAYSAATTRATALLYADEVYRLLRGGFTARAETGELVTLAPSAVQPDVASARVVTGTGTSAAALPAGCVNDGKVDYPGAIDCVLAPATFDCEQTPPGAPCTYDEANRPSDLPIQFVVIHDIEGTAQDALNVFQDPKSGVSIHYIVGSDGTVYQVVREKDIAFHAGNYWYNQRAVGIEHAGFDATGYQWYNATEYLASAKLVAYLLKKYTIPLDHAHIVGHGTVPSPGVQYEPNHVDPGPYWLWDYYFGLIHQQGVPYPTMQQSTGLPVVPGAPRIHLIILSPVMRRPQSDRSLLGPNGTETPANFSFANLYSGPSTASPLIPHKGSTSDTTNETFNIEPNMAYPVMMTRSDAAGTGATMYAIWYGEEDRASSYYADAALAWVAVRPGDMWIDAGTVAHLRAPITGGSSVPLMYGRPDVAANMPAAVIGQAPVGATLVSEMTTTVTDPATGTTTQWLEVNFDHRQAWVPATEVVGR